MAERDLSDEAYLAKQRCRAETNFIKARIAYKVRNSIKLSPMELEYAQMWGEEANNLKSVLSSADVMVPPTPSQIKLKTLTPDDVYVLNCIPKVDIKVKNHGDYALNDLVLEMSHLIDEQTVRNIELALMEKKLK